MLTLLIWACLATAPTECRIYPVASGFVADQQCSAYAPLMVKGWLDMHPDLQMREGHHPLCVPNPEWYLGRFGA